MYFVQIRYRAHRRFRWLTWQCITWVEALNHSALSHYIRWWVCYLSAVITIGFMTFHYKACNLNFLFLFLTDVTLRLQFEPSFWVQFKFPQAVDIITQIWAFPGDVCAPPTLLLSFIMPHLLFKEGFHTWPWLASITLTFPVHDWTPQTENAFWLPPGCESLAGLFNYLNLIYTHKRYKKGMAAANACKQ